MSLKAIHQKTFLVTGAGGGIGRQIVIDLIRRNATVVATDINLSAMEGLEDSVKDYKNRLFTMRLDVTDEASWVKAIETAKSQKAPFYGLINSAGILKPGYLKDVKPEDIRSHLNINSIGPMIGSTLVAAELAQKKEGHIINIASLAGIAAIPGIGLYSASKFAVRGYTLALAEEMRKDNIKVTVICPDAVKTAMVDTQLKSKEAALTFSGGSVLSVEEVSQEIMNIIGSDQLELMLPLWRGAMARLGNTLPEITQFISEPLRILGENTQKNLKN